MRIFFDILIDLITQYSTQRFIYINISSLYFIVVGNWELNQ